MTKRLSPEELNQYRALAESGAVDNEGSVEIAELLGHIEAIEAELRDANYWRERHYNESIAGRESSAKHWQTLSEVRKERAEAKATIAQLAKENRESDDTGEIQLTWRQRAEQAEGQVEAFAENEVRLNAEIARLKGRR